MDEILPLPIWKHFHNLARLFLRTPMDEGASFAGHSQEALDDGIILRVTVSPRY